MWKSCRSHPVVRSYLREYGVGRCWVGWGYKGSGLLARWMSRTFGGALYLFEDAPIRSLRPGYMGAVYGITVDRKGAMFDATGQSSLIEILSEGRVASERASKIIERIRATGASKYNWSIPLSEGELSAYPAGVLLVDQTRGDAALRHAGVSPETFTKMAEDALRETSPDMQIYLKTHPSKEHLDKKSCYSAEMLSHPRITILPSSLSLADCLRFCPTVYVASSLVGMEALIHGARVITYGWNFYAGWGLTEDRGSSPAPPRSGELTLEQLVEGYYLEYSYYADPDTGRPTTLERILDHLEHQQEQWQRLRGNYQLTNELSPWHKHVVQAYLETPSATISTDNGTPCIWGMRAPDAEQVMRIEDGFIRSRGLGANFHYPLSLVMDDEGIYFAADRPSRLETLLENARWTPAQYQEGVELLEHLRTHKITKYQEAHEAFTLPAEVVRAQEGGKEIILVPGQVDSDASITYGSPDFQSNQEFLRHVRTTHPAAYIIYKPHPDLLSRSRADSPFWEGLQEDCDYLATSGDITSWILEVDTVHTLTSTVGFEALIQGVPVHTYGLPFYAGWGLTTDRLMNPRRTRPCTLEELVTAALIAYPTYQNPQTGEFITALRAAQLLTAPSYTPKPPPMLLQVVAKIKQWRNRLSR